MFKPNKRRLSFYITPLAMVNVKCNTYEINNISSLTNIDIVNNNLFDLDDNEVVGDILSLFDEGVIDGVKTGVDLSIYNIYTTKLADKNNYSKYFDKGFIKTLDYADNSSKYYDDINDFSDCLLAEADPLNSVTKIVTTFRGYLSITNDEFSIIKKCDCDSGIDVVYIPQYYIQKYMLRQGDELVCTCNESNGKMIINMLLTINKISCSKWNIDRPWFNNQPLSNKSNYFKPAGIYTKQIDTKFKLIEADEAFIYLNNTNKPKMLNDLVQEFNQMFDNVIYINPNYKHANAFYNVNVIKFCALFNKSLEAKITITMLGIQHARRLMELGKKVAIIIDDIQSVIALDNEYSTELPMCKTLFNTNWVSNGSSITGFIIVPENSRHFNINDLPGIVKNAESLGIVVDNNEIDLFNSYRV
ncbi:MAG: hypothetical protein ACLRFE_00675 [Clostridia bacterium]